MRYIIQRVLGVIPAVLFQILWLTVLFRWLSKYATLLNLILTLLAFLYVLYIISSRNESTYKTLWLLVILCFPVAGTIMYLCFGNKRAANPLKKKLEQVQMSADSEVSEKQSLCTDFSGMDLRTAQTFGYVQEKTGMPICPCEETRYFPLGENAWVEMLEELKKAEHFIFAEYFIVEKGRMWDSMVEIMEQKAACGVDVRVMYDDLGSISTYSGKERLQLQKKGIKCIAFNPLVCVKGTVNYRDHRKMLIIDNRVAFSGGINLADEYINKVEKYGHWKDIAFRITGQPVQNFTRMFTEFWNAFSNDPISTTQLKPLAAKKEITQNNGYMISYYDSPIYSEAVSNNLYVELLSRATRYAWFFTPYLMLGDTLMDAFVLAAQRGVDVRIIMPGIPDKKIVYRMSRSYYQPLLEAGVKIYEYTPGFVHAKGCVVDDCFGTLGTVNLDYRSLFLHFENNSFFFDASILKDLKEDFLATQEKCRLRTLDNIGICFRKWVVDGVLRIFAPLC